MNTEPIAPAQAQDSATKQAGMRFPKKVAQTGVALLIILVVCLLVFGTYRLQTISSKLKNLESISETKKEHAISNVEGGDAQEEEALSSVKKYLPVARKISALSAKVNQLTFVPQVNAPVGSKTPESSSTKTQQSPPANAEIKWWRTVGDKLLTPVAEFFKGLIKIQVIDEVEKSPVGSVAMSPASQALVRQELKLYLLSSKQLILAGSPSDALNDLAEVKILLNKNFAIQSQGVASFTQALNDIEVDIRNLEGAVTKSEPANKATGKK